MNDETARLDRWIEQLNARLDHGGYPVDREAIHILLDLARDAAHQVIRPASPVTLFLVGVAVGRGETLGKAAATVTQLAMSFDSDDLRDLLEGGEGADASVVGDVTDLEFPQDDSDS